MLTEPIHRLIDLARRGRARRRLRRELEALDDALLDDIGLRRKDIPAVVAATPGGRRGARSRRRADLLLFPKPRKGLS